jgi:RNA polymerase subunit RPABC4/transcription elongation factor Spt4
MGFKLRISTGQCACSNCHAILNPSADFCDNCGTNLKGEKTAKTCPSCNSIIDFEDSSCPVCNLRFDVESIKKEKEKIQPQLGEGDEAFIMKLMSWKKDADNAALDTEDDKKEREQALKILKSIAIVEPDEVMEGQIREIEETAKEKELFERRKKELLKLGKPFENILERNAKNMDIIDKELDVKISELKKIEDKTDVKYNATKIELKNKIKQLKAKRDTLVLYEQNILMIGGAYRRLLEQHQNELLRIEQDLKKRVEAFQKEVERRRKQKEKLKKREEALDKREEDLSIRFLELKQRENEIQAREGSLEKLLDDLKARGDGIPNMEVGMAEGNLRDSNEGAGSDNSGNVNKEEWMEDQKKLQAELMKMREDAAEAEQNKEKIHEMDDELKRMTDNLKDRQNDIDEFTKQIKELNAIISEKDGEISNLKNNSPNSKLDEETKKILIILDELLEKLPEEIVDKFARSDDYLLYEKVLEKYKI